MILMAGSLLFSGCSQSPPVSSFDEKCRVNVLSTKIGRHESPSLTAGVNYPPELAVAVTAIYLIGSTIHWLTADPVCTSAANHTVEFERALAQFEKEMSEKGAVTIEIPEEDLNTYLNSEHLNDI